MPLVKCFCNIHIGERLQFIGFYTYLLGVDRGCECRCKMHLRSIPVVVQVEP